MSVFVSILALANGHANRTFSARYYVVSCVLFNSNMISRIILQPARSSEKFVKQKLCFEFLYKVCLQYFSF
jgi:hypothetical protein